MPNGNRSRISKLDRRIISIYTMRANGWGGRRRLKTVIYYAEEIRVLVEGRLVRFHGEEGVSIYSSRANGRGGKPRRKTVIYYPEDLAVNVKQLLRQLRGRNGSASSRGLGSRREHRIYSNRR